MSQKPRKLSVCAVLGVEPSEQRSNGINGMLSEPGPDADPGTADRDGNDHQRATIVLIGSDFNADSLSRRSCADYRFSSVDSTVTWHPHQQEY
jgi:hypothetical protein